MSNETSRTADGYIATSVDQSCGAIYGIGDTPAEALVDARDWGGGTAYGIVAATRRLIDSVVAGSGAPSDQRWSVFTQGGEVYGGALVTNPADVNDYRVADLDDEGGAQP